MNLKNKSASLYDGGGRAFSTAVLPKAGETVVTHAGKRKIWVVRVHDIAVPLRKFLAVAQKAVGKDGWNATRPSVDELLAGSWVDVNQRRFNWPTLFGFIITTSHM